MNPMNNREDVYNFVQLYRYTLLNSNVHFLFCHHLDTHFDMLLRFNVQ